MRTRGATDRARELEELRPLLRRYQVYLGSALAILGVAVMASIALVAFYGFRLTESLSEARDRIASLEESSSAQSRELRQEIQRQQQELTAIRRSADEDLKSIREAHRKLSAVKDPARELGALREANEALWTELAQQRAELVEALLHREEAPTAELAGQRSRFQLGETSYLDPTDDGGAIKGFIPAGEKIHRATAIPANPGLLVIELQPEGVDLGDLYELSVRLVNRSNRAMVPEGLRLDWSFNGRNTGGEVPVGVPRIDARQSALLYRLSGQWTEQHREGAVSVTATLTVDGGVRLSNTLRW